MKSMMFLSLLAIFCISSHSSKIVIEGTWGGSRIRSVIPACPVVYIDENVLSIYLEDELTDLTVVITNSDGNVIYQNCISSDQPAYTHYIRLENRSEDDFSIALSHQYGYLTGGF